MVRKKLLLIIPELMMGGAQRSLSKLSLELSRHHQVWIVIFNTENTIAYQYGGELISLDIKSGSSIFQKANAFMQRVRRLRKLKKELGIDVAISFLEGADYVNVLSRTDEKVILSIRGSKHHDENMVGNFFWLRNKVMIPWLYRKADVIVAVNHGIVQELLQYGLHKTSCVTIGNFYDVQELERLSHEQKTQSLEKFYQDPVLITTGRLAPEKGLNHLIEIFHELRKKHSTLRLILVGDGPLRDDLITLCKDLNLNVETTLEFTGLPDVIFTGNQSNVFKYLHGAKLYLMNSSSEGFPNGLVEAMICRVPVVSSDCPYGPREILAPEFPFLSPVTKPYTSPNGVLMPLIKSGEDKRVWIETINEVLSKNEILSDLSANARERANLFDQKMILSRWYELLE